MILKNTDYEPSRGQSSRKFQMHIFQYFQYFYAFAIRDSNAFYALVLDNLWTEWESGNHTWSLTDGENPSYHKTWVDWHASWSESPHTADIKGHRVITKPRTQLHFWGGPRHCFKSYCSGWSKTFKKRKMWSASRTGEVLMLTSQVIFLLNPVTPTVKNGPCTNTEQATRNTGLRLLLSLKPQFEFLVFSQSEEAEKWELNRPWCVMKEHNSCLREHLIPGSKNNLVLYLVLRETLSKACARVFIDDWETFSEGGFTTFWIH